jgi:transcriptional regulator with XRE-family HTH domain
LRQELYDRVKAGDLDLAEAVRMMRKVAGKSQAEYARLVGIGPRALIDLERGVGNPTLETVRRMLEPFGLELTVRRRGDELEAPRTATVVRALRGRPDAVLPELRRRLAAIIARPDVERVRISVGPRAPRGTRGTDGGRERIVLSYAADSVASALDVQRKLLDSVVSSGKVAGDEVAANAVPPHSGAATYVHLVLVPARR